MSACACDAGEPFATVSPRLEAGVAVPEGRDAGMGWQRLASSYELRFTELSITAGDAVLIDTAEAIGFDPRMPPPGYSLCHNGHCHSDDGRLVSYEEIGAELAGGAGAVWVLALPVGMMDVLAGVSRPLACEPSCDLPLASITQVTMPVTRVRARGLVRDGRAPARIAGEVPWQLELELELELAGGPGEPLMLGGSLELAADRSHAPDVALTLELRPSSRIFDQVVWDQLELVPDSGPAMEPGFDLLGDAAAVSAVLAGLGELELGVEVTR